MSIQMTDIIMNSSSYMNYLESKLHVSQGLGIKKVFRMDEYTSEELYTIENKARLISHILSETATGNELPEKEVPDFLRDKVTELLTAYRNPLAHFPPEIQEKYENSNKLEQARAIGCCQSLL